MAKRKFDPKFSGYVVGAYAASAAHRRWDPVAEQALFERLATDSRVAALELPWLGDLHPFDDAWLFRHFPSKFQAILTDIPFIMSQLSEDATFGLASPDPVGRARAVQSVGNLNSDVKRFNDRQGRAVVSVVEIHSAPRGRGSVGAFAASLEQLQRLEWDGAAIVVEHCDAWKPSQHPEKGFLTLEQELEALESAAVPYGISINWGRSAIEFRDAGRVVEHLRTAKAAGRLAGFMASGTSDQAGPFGYPWIDAHHPFQRSPLHPAGDPGSLLTEEHLVDALRAAGSIDWLGVKVGWSAEISGTIEDRVRMIRAALDACDRACMQASDAIRVPTDG